MLEDSTEQSGAIYDKIRSLRGKEGGANQPVGSVPFPNSSNSMRERGVQFRRAKDT